MAFQDPKDLSNPKDLLGESKVVETNSEVITEDTKLLFIDDTQAQDLLEDSGQTDLAALLNSLLANKPAPDGSSQNDEQRNYLDANTRAFEEQDEKLSSFYYDYISKYYPRAYVIRQKFLSMTPEQIADSLNDIVHVFTKEPWFYFQNTPKGFRLIHYWEYVSDQCGIIHDFLKKAKVDLKTKQISLESGFSWYDYSVFLNSNESYVQKKQNLLDYLKKNHLNLYTAFLSLAFDYQIKFFNEGILSKNLALANKYYSEIEYLLETLRDTPKESAYYDKTKDCKALIGILKKKLGMDSLNTLENNFHSNPDSSNYYKEFTELNDVV